MFASLRRPVSTCLVTLCAVASLSPALAASRVKGNGQVFAQVPTNWVAMVEEGQDANACAADVEAAGAGEVRDILDTIGILLVTTPSASKRRLEALSCIEFVELDGEVIILP